MNAPDPLWPRDSQPPVPPPVDTPSVDLPPPRSVRLQESYNLILGWCLFLVGSWAITLRLSGPRVASRTMLVACLLGLMVLWPVIRLSQESFGGRAQLWRDWFSLNLVAQAVLWPLKATVDWSAAQVLWLSAALMAWSLLTGLIIAWGLTPRRRTPAMCACMILLLGEPLLMGLLNLEPNHDIPAIVWTMRISPIPAVWSMSSHAPPESWTDPNLHVFLVGLAGVLGWILLALCRSLPDTP